MLATKSTCPTSIEIDSEEDDKENFLDAQSSSPKPSNNDDRDEEDDAQSSHSDCMIIEVTSPSSKDDSTRTSHGTDQMDFSLMGMVPEHLPNQTNLLLIYENRIMDVQVFTNIVNLSEQPRITISHSNSLYSIPKRHLYFSMPCDIEHVSIGRQSRVMFRSSSKQKFLLGFIEETPSIDNHLRHLIVFDDGTAMYSSTEDQLHLCLCQDFEQNVRSIECQSQQENLQGTFFYQPVHERTFRLHQYVRVKKFDHQYHNAQIIAIDNSLVKVKFYQRQAQTEVWMHHRSPLIDPTSPHELQPSPQTPSKLSSSVYQFHQCSSLCVVTAEAHFNPRSFTQNPYALPLTCGWSYFHVDRCANGHFTKKPTTHKTYASRSNYLYRSPCGRSFLTLDEVEDYLYRTDSKLTIKYFIDDRSTDLESKFLYDEKYLLHKDISQGKERVRISVYNDNTMTLPDPFVYETENRSSLPLEDYSKTLTCCSCTDNCRDRMKCACWLKTFEQAKLNENEQISNWKRQHYTDRQMIVRFGYTFQRLKTDVWSGIYECNSKCSCHRQHCTNRLVQNGLYQQLQLFHTERKGWGLRVLHDIPAGSFINAYTGELITEEMASTRDYKYLAILDHKSHLSTNGHQKRQSSRPGYAKKMGKRPQLAFKSTPRLSSDSSKATSSDEEDDMQTKDTNEEEAEEEEEHDTDQDEEPCFILDAKSYGSISRFYNHSCKPNVYIQNVFVESHDPRFPVIALFACRTIRAGEEICWDYNYTVGCMPGIRIDCQCQASNCRGRLL